jgi:hypothetical protein
MSTIITTTIDGFPVQLEIFNSTRVRVLKVGDDENPATESEINSIVDKINNTPTEMIQNLITSLTTVPEGKEWWQSRMVWVNVVAIIGAISAYFGLPIHIEPELAMTIYPLILGLINVYLRNKTNKPINHH